MGKTEVAGNVIGKLSPQERKKITDKAWLVARELARKEAKGRVQAFLKENMAQLGTLKADIELFVGGGVRKSSGVVKTINADIRASLLAVGRLSEMAIFKTYHIGRPEMANKIRGLLLTPKPADRVWVHFDEKSEEYIVVGTGEFPPAEWDGYLPAKKVDIL